MKQVFDGPNYRLEVTVLEHLGRPPDIIIYALSQKKRATVGFRSSGHNLYCGSNADTALSILLERVPDAARQMRPQFKKFFRP